MEKQTLTLGKTKKAPEFLFKKQERVEILNMAIKEKKEALMQLAKEVLENIADRNRKRDIVSAIMEDIDPEGTLLKGDYIRLDFNSINNEVAQVLEDSAYSEEVEKEASKQAIKAFTTLIEVGFKSL